MNTNNEMNIIRGILNEQNMVFDLPMGGIKPTVNPYGTSPTKPAVAFNPVSAAPQSASVTSNIQTKRPVSHEELMDMVRKSTAKTEEALQAGKRRDAAVAQYRASAPAAPDEAAIRQDARASFTTDGRWDAEKYKAWRAGRAAEGAQWAQVGAAKQRVADVKKSNERYLQDLKSNLQQSRTAKTPEERKGAFDMGMTNVDTFVSGAETRQREAQKMADDIMGMIRNIPKKS